MGKTDADSAFSIAVHFAELREFDELGALLDGCQEWEHLILPAFAAWCELFLTGLGQETPEGIMSGLADILKRMLAVVYCLGYERGRDKV